MSKKLVGRVLTEKDIKNFKKRHGLEIAAKDLGIKDWGIVDFARKAGYTLNIVYNKKKKGGTSND